MADKVIRHPEHVNTAQGWQIDVTDFERVDTLAPAFLFHNGKRVAILTHDGTITLLPPRKP